MEHVCSLSSDTLDNVVELAFSLLLLLCSKLFWICLTHGMGCNFFYILNGCVSGSGDNSGGLGSSNVNQGNDHLLKFGLHQKSRLHTIHMLHSING
jgi:DDB1- and CUL4-associated factor 1